MAGDPVADQEKTEFGPNEWLIDEMRARFQENPALVSDAWREFFQSKPPAPQEKQPAAAQPPAAPEPPAKRSEPPAKRPEPPIRRSEPVPAATVAKAESNGTEDGGSSTPLSRTGALIAERMQQSLQVPTATSVRTVPAKLLEVNRTILNNHLQRSGAGKVSFTHIIAWAVVKAVAKVPEMNHSYSEAAGKPATVKPDHLNLGLAVDVKREGVRTLLVPNIKAAETLDFPSFLQSYEDIIRRIDSKKVTAEDFAGTTLTITNPGTLGTVQSVPRLMAGQSAIIGVGAIAYPAEYQGADPETVAEVGIGKVLTLTSTYDHRVIQGASSGEFLAEMHRLLLDDAFYDEIFRSMEVPYVPVRWSRDTNPQRDSLGSEQKQARVLQLINMYRVRGHLIADLDPLDAKAPTIPKELDPSAYGLTIWDLDRTFATGGLAGHDHLKLSEALRLLRDAYCRTGTVEYMHISDPEQKQWIQRAVEDVSTEMDSGDQQRILHKLNEAEAFETFLHRKYVGHKRFSLEGGESLIPVLDAVLEDASEAGIEEIVIGMSHRGRLNVLANVIGKSYSQIFREFEGDIDPESAQGSGDVKYHIGAEGTFTSSNGSEMAVSVASNPSHLESVDPVVEGMVRAKLDLRGAEEPVVMPLLIHGDAAFAGQGVVAETLNMSGLGGYSTGGTIHIVVNNQLGFTTGSDYARSSRYATDIAKMVESPIFHVNGDDPEACVRMARLAVAFRQAFHKDVVIDMWCYRRWGHNEADEPSFTQPLMYAHIDERRSVRKLYTESLIRRGHLSMEDAEKSLEDFRSKLQNAFDETREGSKPGQEGRYLKEGERPAPVSTGVERPVLDRVVEALTTVPPGFNVHPKLARWLQARSTALDEGTVDFALAESLAFGSLLSDGVTVRLSGQDSRRGTFSQRHSALVDQQTGAEYLSLGRLGDGRFHAYDSLLSEFAVLGFEYGYSVAAPEALVLWEAQFGDFGNGAQVIIDQFIAAGEDKWAQPSGVVLLLPHGYEGQGPEHSNARPERFLQLAAEDNMTIAVPSTAAQYFHLLRRQALSPVKRPLIVMTPKSLLRLKDAHASAAELTEGSFRSVLEEEPGAGTRRLLLCSGKVYYDLVEHRAANDISGISIARIEQLYPFPAEEIRKLVDAHPGAQLVWVQEEPENMGAFRYMKLKLLQELELPVAGVFRKESASPATGSASAHAWEQEILLRSALTV